jgi:hypothetical protein
MRDHLKPFLILGLTIVFFNCASSPADTVEQRHLKRSPDFYEGDGGKGMTLAVLQPGYTGANSKDSWIPIYVQGILTGNFNIFSNISVLDRQNVEKIISEQEFAASGYFSDDDYISISNLTSAQYILLGTLNHISALEVSIQLSISDAETGERRVSFAKICTIDDIKNASVLNEAAIQLLSLMGVNLTEKGSAALFSSKPATAGAETVLVKGIAAQNNRTYVEALSYYYEAVSFDPAMKEANARLSAVSADIRDSSLGQAVRNDIENRNNWTKLLDECKTFLNTHLPFEIIYDPALTQGKIDYNNETVDLYFMLKIIPSNSGFRAI